MPLLAVTVLGHDRPGIIADVTGALAELGGNLEDSSMTLLRGHFAMTLVVACEAPSVDVQSTLAASAARPHRVRAPAPRRGRPAGDRRRRTS